MHKTMNLFGQTYFGQDEEILDEVAAILAQGFLRHHSSRVFSMDVSTNPENPIQPEDSPAEPREMT